MWDLPQYNKAATAQRCYLNGRERIDNPASNRRRPNPLDGIGFVDAGPGRHRHADRLDRLLAVTAELKTSSGRYRDRQAGADLDNLLARRILTPHPPAPAGKIPDFLDGAVGHRLRDHPGHQREQGHAAAWAGAEDAHLGAVRGDGIGNRGGTFGAEISDRHVAMP